MQWEISSGVFKTCAEHAPERLVQFDSGTPHCITSVTSRRTRARTFAFIDVFLVYSPFGWFYLSITVPLAIFFWL